MYSSGEWAILVIPSHKVAHNYHPTVLQAKGVVVLICRVGRCLCHQGLSLPPQSVAEPEDYTAADDDSVILVVGRDCEQQRSVLSGRGARHMGGVQRSATMAAACDTGCPGAAARLNAERRLPAVLRLH